MKAKHRNGRAKLEVFSWRRIEHDLTVQNLQSYYTKPAHLHRIIIYTVHEASNPYKEKMSCRESEIALISIHIKKTHSHSLWKNVFMEFVL